LLTNRTQFCTADLGFVDAVGGLSVLNAFLGGLKNKIKLNEAEMKMESVNLTLETKKQWWKIIIHAIRLFSTKYGKKKQSLTDGEQIVTKGVSVSNRFVRELKDNQ